MPAVGGLRFILGGRRPTGETPGCSKGRQASVLTNDEVHDEFLAALLCPRVLPHGQASGVGVGAREEWARKMTIFHRGMGRGGA